MSAEAGEADALSDALVGQAAAEQLLRAALERPSQTYLFVGPPGVGKREAASVFVQALLCDSGSACGSCRSCLLVRDGAHPDSSLLGGADGSELTIDAVRALIGSLARRPVMGARQVALVEGLDGAVGVVPALLKLTEEPPRHAVIVMVADSLPSALSTLRSRSVEVRFGPLSPEALSERLRRRGVAPEQVELVAERAEGRLDRAMVLASRPDLAERLSRWREVLGALDGTGATLERWARLLEPGEGGRREREEELRAGLAEVARSALERARSGSLSEAAAIVDALALAAERLGRNPNERLLLRAFLVRLQRASLSAGRPCTSVGRGSHS
jgi:DNA polymerase-3 subunit delta'